MGLIRKILGWDPASEPDPEAVPTVMPVVIPDSDEEHAIGEGRARHNTPGQLILADEKPQYTATQLIERAGDSVPALAQALTVIAERFEQSVQASHALNRSLGEFQAQVIGPFREELRFLRFNLGDKVNQTTTNMEVMVDQLEKVVWGALRASGLSDEQIRKYREERGMQPEAPSGEELELHVAEHQGLLEQVATLTAQNQRLLAQLAAKHVQWPEDGGNWVYHHGCQCDACRAEELHKAMGAEASGAARKKVAPRPKKKRSGA